MTRRTALWLFGGATLALFAVLAAIDGRMWEEGGPGVVGFELAGSEARSRDILAEWGPQGRDAARLSLILDFPYIVAYGTFLTLAVAAVRDAARGRDWNRLASAGSVIAFMPAVAALLDALENVGLLLALDENGGAAAPIAATVLASVKFMLSAVVAAYLLVVLARLAHDRFPRPTRIAAAAFGAVAVAVLALNAWRVERATEPAEADIGRILQLPQGEIQVREDGDADDPPLLLIHGYAASMHWWDEVVPRLAREHRVIRVDLLGHGGSEKPRGGYAIEDQADLVAAALDRLGVRRTAVAGHSMGGIVATALVERHPALVSRLLTIGTPPDEKQSGPPVGDRLVALPVVGPAIWTLLSEDYVRSRVEATSPPEIDLPAEISDDPGEVTYRVFRESREAIDEYWDEAPLDERLADEGVPLTVIVGEEDDPEESEAFRHVPGARLIVLDGLGHSPQLESPERTARLILELERG